MGVVATEQIVLEMCKETGEPGFLNNQTIWGLVFDGIRDLSLYNMPTWDTVKGLTLNSYNAIAWPDACVKPLLTFIERNGRALALHVDDNLLSTVNNTVGTLAEADQQIQDFFRIDGFWEQYPYQVYNFGLGELYGWGNGYGHLGMVTHNKNKRMSYISGCTLQSNDTFGFFFKGDGLSNCPKWVPSETKEAIEAFVLYKYYRTRNPSLGQVNRNIYKEEFTKLSKWYDNDGELSWIDAFRSNYKSSPKI